MKSYILLIYLFLFKFALVYGQVENETKILGVDGKPLQAGLYKSLSEFINNNPSRKGIFAKSESYNLLAQRYRAKIVEQDSATKQLKAVEEPFWGFATKEQVFIYSNKELCYLEVIGKYSVYREQIKSIEYGMQTNRGKWMLVDTKTGAIAPLQQKGLIPILKEHPEIFGEYQKDKLPMGEEEMMKHYMKYLKKINEVIK